MAKALQSIGLVPKAPSLPKIPEPIRAPDPDSQAAKLAARKKTEAKKSRSEGRSQNIRGGLYGGLNLGGTG